MSGDLGGCKSDAVGEASVDAERCRGAGGTHAANNACNDNSDDAIEIYELDSAELSAVVQRIDNNEKRRGADADSPDVETRRRQWACSRKARRLGT